MGERQESLWSRINRNLRYIISGVWNDTRDHWSVKMVKIINLSVQSFLDRDLQLRAASLTYSTVLAIVPALAMLFAIARGFGFQNLMQSELLRYFPSQRQALENALVYVDNYLSQASQGIFIGIGLIFLLWTLVSLMSNVENTFNHVWGITTRRSLQRKFTDYSALFLLLPVLIVCSAGISIFMSDAVQRVFEGKDLSPMVHRLLSFMPTVISWIIFTAAYYMVPNTRVKLTGALCAGILCGTLFQVVQMLFMSGQIYVSKYNAIYGSFAFLPLMLVWMQISWLITLAGVVLTYAWQNFDSFVYRGKAQEVSPAYSRHLTLAVLALAATGTFIGLEFIMLQAPDVAIAEVKADSVWMIDASTTQGVTRRPLERFLEASRLPDGSAPLAINFVERTKTMVLMSDAVIIPACRAKGTALLAARFAHSLGIPVFAIAGGPEETRNAGCNRLIKERTADIITSFEELQDLAI